MKNVRFAALVAVMALGCGGGGNPDPGNGGDFPPVDSDKYGINVVSAPAGARITCRDLQSGVDVVSDEENILTPKQLVMSRLSDYRVTVTLPGYQPATRDVMEHELVLGAAVEVSFDLVPAPEEVYSVTVEAAKPGPIFMDGADTGKIAPAAIAGVPRGEHVFDVRLSGHLSIPWAVFVESDVSVRVSIEWDVNGIWNCDRRPESREAVMSVDGNTFWISGLDPVAPMVLEGDRLSYSDPEGASITGSISNDGHVASWTITGPGGSHDERCER